MSLSPGSIVDAYEVVSQLGEGGMGQVFLARDTRLGRKVALKVLRQDGELDERARRRFAQEARTASSLNHPNVISIFDVGQWQGLDFIAMESSTAERCVSWSRMGRLTFAGVSTVLPRRPTRWLLPMTRTSCIGTSSQKTSSSQPAAMSKSSTSAWRSWSTSSAPISRPMLSPSHELSR